MKKEEILVLLLGGNMPNTIDCLAEAKDLLSVPFGPLRQQSSLYKTAAWGFQASAFINQALVFASALPPLECLNHTQAVERALGRSSKTTNGVYHDRPIDIDIIFYGQQTVDMPRLQIPHPLMSQRRFVLLPLSEIMPNRMHPVLHSTVAQLAQACPDTLEVQRIVNEE